MNGLVCLGKMLEHLDKYAVLDDILPLMNQIPSREPPTLMAILGEVDLKTSMGMELRFGKNSPLRILFFAFVSRDNTRFMFRSFELPFELHFVFLFPGIFKQTMLHKKLGMDKDYLATKAIPFLFPLAVEPGLNLSQVKQTVQYSLIMTCYECLSYDVVTSLTYGRDEISIAY